ncbi:MAG: hypothetical protein PHU03_04705, partial [Syntrophales bacterium]|nr:hypothetical protein [Syntrophales bacterium]
MKKNRSLILLSRLFLIVILLFILLPEAGNAAEPGDDSAVVTAPGIIDFGTIKKPETAMEMLYFHQSSGAEGEAWRLESSASWVVLDIASGRFMKSSPQRVIVTVDSGAMEPGLHSAHVVITSGNDRLHVPVLVYVEEKVPSKEEGAILRKLAIEPVYPLPMAPGLKRALRAMGSYSDGRILDITKDVRWTCDDVNIAEFVEAGLLAGKMKGFAHVTAEKGGVRSDALSIFVDELQGPVLGLTEPDTSLGRMEVNSVRDLEFTIENKGTGLLSCRLSPTAPWIKPSFTGDSLSGITPGGKRAFSVTLNTTGLSEGDHEGALVVRSNGGDRVVTFNVTIATIESVLISPVRIIVPEGQKRRLTATALWSDGARSDVSSSRNGRWINSNLSVASFAGRTGLFTAQSPGVTEVKRIEKGVESTVALIEVTEIDPRAKIRISPHEIDMGIVGPGETSEGLFHARKTGDEPADIR